jgi:molybdate transport system substrate-binding protein
LGTEEKWKSDVNRIVIALGNTYCRSRIQRKLRAFMKLFLQLPAAILLLLVLGSAVGAQTLRVAAASDLQFAMNDLVTQFEKQSGSKVEVSYGSSGNFRAQIENGAPFDVFFSADAQYPEQLVQAGVADQQTLFTYAQGHLVIWAPSGANLRLAERGLDALKDPRVVKIAIANPEHAPYGRAAVAALQKAGLYDQLKSKLVLGENISQAAQYVQSGSAQAGIIAMSLTYAESMKGGERWEIPGELYPPILQKAVVVSASPNKPTAGAFLEFVRGEKGKSILSKYGLAPPLVTTKA